MGAYAEAVRAAFPGAAGCPPLPAGRGWVVLAHADLPPDAVRRLFPVVPRLLVLTPTTERPPEDGVSYARIEPGPPPCLSGAARRLLGETRHDAAVLLDGVELASGRVLLELARLGVRRIAWREGAGWTSASPRRVVWSKPLRRIERSLHRTAVVSWVRRRVARAAAHEELRARNAWSFHGEREWLRHMQRVGVRPSAPRAGQPLDVLLYIGQLNSGGAERQLCNLAAGLARLGHRPRVVTTYPLADEDAHYCSDLARAGVPFTAAGGRGQSSAIERLLATGVEPELVGSLPGAIRDPVLDLAGELLSQPTDVLHCWLDYPNVIGAAAGALVGHPHVALSTRNVNPRHFPAFYQPWMDTWYRFFSALPQVHLLANSRPGAEDYARWLQLDPARFAVIRNGVDFSSLREPSLRDVGALRRQLGAKAGAPVIAGVFRLASEKQPVVFLDVVARVRAAFPDLKVALVGVGGLADEVRRLIAARYLDNTVVLLGQRKDVAAVFGASDVSLLTSEVEGTPNVVLEAQWLGCPPVATAAGGTPEALQDGVTGLLAPVGDVRALAHGVIGLLADRSRRRAFGLAGRRFVQQRFGLERMVDETLRFYEAVLAGPAGGPRGTGPRTGAAPARPVPASLPPTAAAT